MLKFIASAFFIGTTAFGFSTQGEAFPEETPAREFLSMISKIPSEELPLLLERIRTDENFYVYSYLGLALINIELGDYSLAIENLNRAEASYFATPTTQPEMEFIISFARAVAYDNLNMSKECAQSLGLMILAASEEDDQEEVLSEEPNVLQILASRASSSNLRKFLLAMADDSDE